ncbi:MAG: COX15/CtaA family protein [Burkholderiaceae bacterium]
MTPDVPYDFTPLLRLALLGLVLACVPLAWLWLRNRGAPSAQRQRALTLLILFLTFDLVLFGAFTRLTDSGLGCPDWPGCYGSASPVGARAQIDVAQTAMPTGPVTHGKAWIEMIHRYLATMVGALILVLAASSWAAARRRSATLSPWWPTLTLLWVCIQGAFGALTVTMKLYPTIVTLHLLGGMVLLALLAAQAQAGAPAPLAPLALSPRLRAATWGVAGLSALQIALGGWVSTNYAVLACSDFPLCHGSWWPEMDFAGGFTVRRELGRQADGSYLSFAALVAIHYVHRLVAYLLLGALATLAWVLWARRDQSLRRWAVALSAVAAWQLASGLSNVLLSWPLLGAVAHTAGAAALVLVLTLLLVRARPMLSSAAPNGHARPAPTPSS